MNRSVIYGILAGLTLIYLIQSAVMDQKERKVYYFPAWVLAALWMTFGVFSYGIGWELFLYEGVQAVLYFLFTKLDLWGGGDTDLMLLLSMLDFAVFGGRTTLTGLLFMECISLVVTLSGAFLCALIAGRKEKRAITKETDVAVAPGFLIGSVFVMACGLLGFLPGAAIVSADILTGTLDLIGRWEVI